MGVNVGSFLAPLVCGYFGETGNPNDFKWGFLIAAIVTVFTVILFETQKNKYLIGPDGKQLGIIPDAKKEQPQATKTAAQSTTHNSKKKRNYLLLGVLTIALAVFFYWCFGNDWISIGIFTACIVFPVSILLEGSLTKIERDRIFVIYIIAFFVIFFWAAYEQAGASLTLFASEQTDRVIFGWEMPASWIQSFNPFFVVILAAIMPGVWGFLNKRGMEPASPTKQAIGLLLLSLGYLVICFAVKDVQPGVKVSLIWLTGLYFIHTMGEIALSPIGLFHGEQAHSYPLCFADDGYMVSLHGHSQQVCGYTEWALSRSRKSKDTAWLPHRNDVRLLHGICRNVRHRIAYPFPTLKEIAEDDARSGIKSLFLRQLSKNSHLWIPYK